MMAAFFHGETEMKEPSSDLFMVNQLDQFLNPTTISNAHNHHLYNLCFESQPREVVSKYVVGDHIQQGNSSISNVSNEGVTQSYRVLAPTYLRAAQELLNELVNVGNGSRGAKQEQEMTKDSAVYGLYSCGHKPDVPAYRQELHMKKTKLISLVEKVEERYKQYHNQMQTIISSFERAVGIGSAKPYTQMALETISKQFRAVKDMICLQIKHINKLLEAKDFRGGVSLVDQDEQLKPYGKMPYHNAWRSPQRGLPETAVFTLRAWLFQHFLHPYPKDSDKEMLAKQTGLTKSQVSNWFINARVRVWKPMVEEMYLEEMNNEESRKGDTKLSDHSNKGSSSKQPYNITTQNESMNLVLPTFHQGFIANDETTPMQNSSSSCSVVTFRKQQHNVNQANLIHFNGGFENYHAMLGNGVSLSLSLPYSCDQPFNNIQFGSTSHGTEISGIYPSSTYQIMD